MQLGRVVIVIGGGWDLCWNRNEQGGLGNTGGVVLKGEEQQDWGFDCFDDTRLKHWIDIACLVVCGMCLFAALLVGLFFDVLGFFAARAMMLLIVLFLNY